MVWYQYLKRLVVLRGPRVGGEGTPFSMTREWDKEKSGNSEKDENKDEDSVCSQGEGGITKGGKIGVPSPAKRVKNQVLVIYAHFGQTIVLKQPQDHCRAN